MKIESLSDLRPGDIMISDQSTAPNKVIVYGGQLLIGEHFRIGEFAAGHAGVIGPEGKTLIEAMPSGARERELRETDWSPNHWYFRLPEDYLGQHLDAALVARSMVGTPYSWASYVYLAAHRFGFKTKWLEKLIDRREGTIPNRIYDAGIEPARTIGLPREAICSVLADQAWSLTGYKLIQGTKPQVVTPGMLTKQLLFKSGVIRSTTV
jgi:hypothetical protein